MQTYTVRLSDENVERLRAAAEARHQAPDEVLQATVEEAISHITPLGSPSAQFGANRTSDPMIAVMRARGHLVEAPVYHPPAGVEIPPYGSPAFDQLLELLAVEASDALERSGLDITDLVER